VCPDDETLAAYVDGRLSPQERQELEAHLTSCPDCYELVAEVLQTDDGFRESARLVTGPSRFERRSVFAAASLLAVAASLVMLVLSARSPLTPLVSAVGEERLTTARPTGGFKYGPLRSPVRGSSPDGGQLRLRAEAARLREQASATGAPRDLHAWGVAQLIAGDAAGSAATLDSARNASPSVAAYQSDYGAAALTIFQETRQDEDGARALEALTRATSLDPKLAEAWFNKALVLEALGHTAEAIQAWSTYLDIDRRSPWSDEARHHRDALQKPQAGG
jgi:anti-sigma factor RsiW